MLDDRPDRLIAPCGPECRHAIVLPATYREWVWCTRRGAPHSATESHDCWSFAARSGLEPPNHGLVLEAASDAPGEDRP